MAVATLTQEQLKEILHYDPSTGVFIWKKTSSPYANLLVGLEAGCIGSRGYREIRIAQKLYHAHRLAWLYNFGEFPKGIIDHKNQDKLDNRLSNLRVVSHSENRQNSKISKNNTSGRSGVWWCNRTRKWRAAIWLKEKRKNLGYYTKIKDAITARQNAEKEFYRLP